MTIEFHPPTPYQTGLEIARKLAESSGRKGYFETILGEMEEIPVIKEEDKPSQVTLGMGVGMVINAPKILLGLKTSAVNFICKNR